MKTEMFPLKHRHISEEWSEEGSGDGYWIALKAGYKWAGDPIGSVHTIHEDTLQKAWQEYVMKCNCRDCQTLTKPA